MDDEQRARYDRIARCYLPWWSDGMDSETRERLVQNRIDWLRSLDENSRQA